MILRNKHEAGLSVVQQRGVQQPRAHHPAERRGPRQHRAGADVHVQRRVHAALERRQMRPRNRLGRARRAAAKENVRHVVGRARLGVEPVARRVVRRVPLAHAGGERRPPIGNALA